MQNIYYISKNIIHFRKNLLLLYYNTTLLWLLFIVRVKLLDVVRYTINILVWPLPLSLTDPPCCATSSPMVALPTRRPSPRQDARYFLGKKKLALGGLNLTSLYGPTLIRGCNETGGSPRQ